MAGAHRVGIDGGVNPLLQLVAADADIHVDGLGALPQPIEMLIEEGDAAGVDAQAFPHAITQHEAGIEHAHHRLGAEEQLAIDVDQDRLVARVRNEIMGAQGCGHGWLLLEQAVGRSAELRCAFALGFRAHQLRFKPRDALVEIDDGEAIKVLPGQIGQQVTLLLGQVGFVEHNRYG